MLSKCWLNTFIFFSWQERNLSEHRLGCLACKACEWALGVGKKWEELEICWTLSPEFCRIWYSEFRREIHLLVSDRTVLWDKNGLHFPQIPRPRPHVANGLPQYSIKKKIPFYIHVAEDKEKTQQILLSFGFKNAFCGWHQRKCTPKRYCWWDYRPFQVFLIREKTSVQKNVVVYTSNKAIHLLGLRPCSGHSAIIVLSSFSCILQNIRSLAPCCHAFPLRWEMSQSWNYPVSVISANISHFILWRRLLSGKNFAFSCF